MSSFTTPLVVAVEDNGRDYTLMEPFVYHINHINSGKYVEVPKYFKSNFANVPRPFWALLPPAGKYSKASVVHDYLCLHRTIISNGVPVTISRKECDEIFLEAMEVLKVGKLTRYVMYYAVRAYATVKRIK